MRKIEQDAKHMKEIDCMSGTKGLTEALISRERRLDGVDENKRIQADIAIAKVCVMATV
jgi:hypothetical protein